MTADLKERKSGKRISSLFLTFNDFLMILSQIEHNYTVHYIHKQLNRTVHMTIKNERSLIYGQSI
ncbi:hypothetical protein CLOHYLEM_04762 [[Clostridium] hylemonae DSM 15053]|uniref:Uncharacterized protein n=1 Tax=[Clostridium] hylemonae DSM 15053 TaxID=553973 RepID=C0BY74_9FIRM|nr:hypothetical protein CLOHYLEM_04762 [[Clostridium] hylemonae DSM 15053]